MMGGVSYVYLAEKDRATDSTIPMSSLLLATYTAALSLELYHTRENVTTFMAR